MTETIRPKLSAYIITYNEAEKFREAIKTVAFADEIVVVDSHSKDDTVKIAEEYGAKVVQVPFRTFGELRNKAIEACTGEWIFSLDTDERCTPAAEAEIKAIINGADSQDVYFTPRKNFFMGRWIKHCGWYPDYRQPQLFRNGSMHYDDGKVHEEYIVTSTKPMGHMKNDIWQIPFINLDQMLHKANRYSTLSDARLSKKGINPTMWMAFGHGTWSFIRMYIIKLGFLDGWPGFVLSVGSFIGSFFRYAKYYEMKKLPKQPDGF